MERFLMQSSLSTSSLIYPHGSYDSSCNYCDAGEDKKGRICYGMVADQLTCEDYQLLIDQGWRRSGTFLYKPNNSDKKTCCPQYTIRLDTSSFKPSKDNKSTIKKFNNYILNNIIKEKDSSTTSTTKDIINTTQIKSNTKNNNNKTNDENIIKLNNDIIEIILNNEFINKFNEQDKKILKENLKIKINSNKMIKETGSYSLSFGIFNKYRSELNQHSITIDQIINFTILEFNKTINNSDYQFNLEKGQNNHINFKMINSSQILNDSTKTKTLNIQNNSNKNSTTTATTATTTTTTTNEPKHKFEISIHKPKCTDEVFSLYCKYQKIIHKEDDEKTKSGFKRFLVDSPLIPIIHPDESYDDYVYDGKDDDDDDDDKDEKEDDEDEDQEDDEDEDDGNNEDEKKITKENKEKEIKNHIYKIGKKSKTLKTRKFGEIKTPKPGYGSFHQYYRLDGKLVGVGVIDILPECLSSVYFFYDPDFNFLSLGKYSALNEIEWVQKVSQSIPQLKYYYMGYYIHSCQKMKYKANYQPSQLLCLETFKWVEFKKAISFLQPDKKYSRFYFDENENNNNEKLTYFEKEPELLERVKFRQKNFTFHFSDVSVRFQNLLKDQVIDYINHVGPELTKELIFYFK
ncbi:hypothetical protein DDB_G0269024 [Dictyostelium discoideum AX4]|uniref:Arginyl-tRNA--protein transferase 1 n=1 Tax=Dictyostelium discoideum TaxID=44689 RepID=ATE1_DICDI|nr:hypothetical protein DDB_G0269024 [Dictyostelium discoideum AX4]Q55EI0.1 RecName: Full=Arginyl-tRNA--protein transferase 1; Short=Arginyltransferase 1; Short=R-transferase 1; AltName: Full=Arginine-tRNA--protein transferase 1 [Dictyostelium discoideum]EAL73101.1 hypothetical protein DDB_G0269024 [Dictyostelium discoideum AX4]|eukprot:XP_647040.1 hypothetical protein DDB_G0269024 [Dictyostelium discoideum AX4]